MFIHSKRMADTMSLSVRTGADKHTFAIVSLAVYIAIVCTLQVAKLTSIQRKGEMRCQQCKNQLEKGQEQNIAHVGH
jgi:hypothetical protein